MRLKPLNEMTERELKDEVKRRTDCGVEFSLAQVLLRLRENDIGTENLKPTEPEWKRWRRWPEEKPINLSSIEFLYNSEWHDGVYIENGAYRFVSSSDAFRTCVEWRYLTEPPRWRNVERDGEPSAAGWYWVRLAWGTIKIDCWNPGIVAPCNRGWRGTRQSDVIAYHPIAPAPPLKEEETK